MAGGSNNNSVEINVPKLIGYAKASGQKNARVERFQKQIIKMSLKSIKNIYSFYQNILKKMVKF